MICRSVGRSRVQERKERERGREEGGGEKRREGAAPLGNLSRGNGGEMIRRLGEGEKTDPIEDRDASLLSLSVIRSRGIDPGLRTIATTPTINWSREMKRRGIENAATFPTPLLPPSPSVHLFSPPTPPTMGLRGQHLYRYCSNSD